MADLRGFDASKVKPFEGFEPIPEGIYRVTIVDSELNPCKSGTGKHMDFTYEVADGDYRGSKVMDILNLDNPSEKTVQIAKGTLSAICRAVNVMTPMDSVDLHGIPLFIKVTIEERPGKNLGDAPIKGNKIVGRYHRDKVPGGAYTHPAAEPAADDSPFI